MIKCPNCKQTVTADSEFCIFCGTKLPSTSAVTTPVPAGTSRSVLKKCKNGHEFDDADLLYCPICGLPFAGSVSKPIAGPTWKCSCGHENPGENNFCENCSRAKEIKKRTLPTEPPAIEHMEIPAGMFAPSEGDLIRKKRS